VSPTTASRSARGVTRAMMASASRVTGGGGEYPPHCGCCQGALTCGATWLLRFRRARQICTPRHHSCRQIDGGVSLPDGSVLRDRSSRETSPERHRTSHSADRPSMSLW
jgi:hypothetical protein